MLNMVEILAQKRHGHALDDAQIAYVVRGCADGSIPDYQLSAWLMAVCCMGMDARETATLSLQMARSGDIADLSAIAGIKADKHSTGGVGDKTTLITAPIAAACGLKVAKMSGRGLGYTGGTVDKLESIPGMEMTLPRQRFVDIVNEIGICVAGQSGDLAPADKKLYALRDVTATVDSLALIASSIMSKKLASGADVIALDVKYGSGAFMKTPQDAVELARAMVGIAAANGRRAAALVTDMDRPLGHTVGNSLEVAEAVAALQGEGPADLTQLSLHLATLMLMLGQGLTAGEAYARAQEALESGAALGKLLDMVQAQGGDIRYLQQPERFPRAAHIEPVLAPRDGFIRAMDTERIGSIAAMLGAGRLEQGDAIDAAAGIMLEKKTGDAVQAGEPLAFLHTARADALPALGQAYLQAVEIGAQPLDERGLIYARIDEVGGVHPF